jgi:hypothetical protein
MKTSYFSDAFCFDGGGGQDGGGGFILRLSVFVKFSSRRCLPFLPHLLSLISIGNPNYKSSVQIWQTFFYLLHAWQTEVRL